MTRMQKYTVVSFDEDNGQINLNHVKAKSGLASFAVAAAQLKGRSITFVAALAEHVNEGSGVDLPGDGLVDIQTVLEQSDVFR